jgi:hypothetical protein
VNSRLYAVETYQTLKVPTKIARGKVSDINYVGSSITIIVKQADGKEEKVTFAVTDKTKVLRKKVNVSFAEIMTGDEVIIEYFDDPKETGPQEACRIELIKR